MNYETVFITPNASMADELNYTYDRELSPPRTIAISVWTNWKGRANKIYVMPIPKSYDEDMRHNFEQALRETAQCRLVPGGEMIRL